MSEPLPKYATAPAPAAPAVPLLDDVLVALRQYHTAALTGAALGPADALRLDGLLERVQRARADATHAPDPDAECVVAELRIPAAAGEPDLTFHTTVQVVPKAEIRFVSRDLSGEVWWSDRADDPILLADVRVFPQEGDPD